MRLLAAGTVAALLLSAAATFASEPRWIKLSRSMISSSYLDVHNLPRNAAGNYLYTIKTVPVMAGTIDEEYERHDIGQVILRGEINCSANTYKEDTAEIFSSSGALLGIEKNEKGFRPVDEMSQEGELSRLLCRRHVNGEW